MDRRAFARLIGGAVVVPFAGVMVGGRAVQAQAAADLGGLGLPEVTVTITDAGYQLTPPTAVAGWTLVTLRNRQEAGDTGADIMLLPRGETIEGLLAAVATPTAAPPAWVFESTFAGAPWVPAGTSAQAVVLLTAGDWGVFSPAPLAPSVLTVSGGDGTPPAPPTVNAAVDVTMQEFAFVGLEEPLVAGPQIWRVTNAGRQPHLMTVGQLPEGTTQAQFLEELAATMSGPPPTDESGPAGPSTVGGCSTLSGGQSLYLALDLAVGTYGAVCFFPDEETGAPHVMLGMVQVFSVA